MKAASVLNSWIVPNYSHFHSYHSNITDYSTQYRVALLLDRVGNMKLVATKHGRVALSRALKRLLEFGAPEASFAFHSFEPIDAQGAWETLSATRLETR